MAFLCSLCNPPGCAEADKLKATITLNQSVNRNVKRDGVRMPRKENAKMGPIAHP